MDSPVVRRVLAVDNEQGMLEVVCESLARLPGVSVDGQLSARKASELLEQEHYDLLVTNISMPEVSGIRLLERARELVPDMPVLVLTGYPDAETAARCRALGARGYLRKPFDPMYLIDTVRGLLPRTEAPPSE